MSRGCSILVCEERKTYQSQIPGAQVKLARTLVIQNEGREQQPSGNMFWHRTRIVSRVVPAVCPHQLSLILMQKPMPNFGDAAIVRMINMGSALKRSIVGRHAGKKAACPLARRDVATQQVRRGESAANLSRSEEIGFNGSGRTGT